MDQNRKDYAELGQPRPWQPPTWAVPVATAVLLSALCGTGLVIALIFMAFAWLSAVARA
jgi:hypothetical protein